MKLKWPQKYPQKQGRILEGGGGGNFLAGQNIYRNWKLNQARVDHPKGVFDLFYGSNMKRIQSYFVTFIIAHHKHLQIYPCPCFLFRLWSDGKPGFNSLLNVHKMREKVWHNCWQTGLYDIILHSQNPCSKLHGHTLLILSMLSFLVLAPSQITCFQALQFSINIYNLSAYNIKS